MTLAARKVETPTGDSYSLTRVTMEAHAIVACGTLAPQELEVLRLLAHGLSLKTVGAEMGLCETTVKHYVGNIARKTGFAGRGNMVLLALRAGIANLWSSHPAQSPKAT